MSVDPKGTALFAYLKRKHDVYAGKVLELRDAVQGWLEYIPHTFPHYTRHTLGHSDEIISQLSKLLFTEEDPEQPVIPLSATEAYILAACAYLHDAGMVVSDRAKAEILTSDAWREWTTGEGGGAKRWGEIQALRGKASASDAGLHFAADLQTRFILAEFVRRGHHLRAADVITQHQSLLGRFAFDDDLLQRTISDVCVAHGLRPNELEDAERYPDWNDVCGEPVNVRLMAILLRLADLLDMSSDRACPLLLSAASPLPADSLAHWAQYKRITRRVTAPHRIVVRARCQTQEEHRTLRDWCQWLVDEVTEARKLMVTAERHAGWRPPAATLDGAQPTIVIRPAPGATYIPLDWRFELDAEAVLERLIHDVHGGPETFIRELIQNALDANRCEMYADLKADGMTPPEYPTQVEEQRRQRYPVRISLRAEQMVNELSGETEERQVLTVEDRGIGMDREIIQRYFLQVARSYYLTEEFRRTYGFVPTSRFGVGFLSVFAVSDHITVDTYKPSSPAQDGPLRLTLTGPRNYLLTDEGQRKTTGTAIEVVLREPMNEGKLTELVSGWCRRVEFPVAVDDLGHQTTVEAERPEDFTFDVPDPTEDGARFVVRAFPIGCPGVEGEIYIFQRIDRAGEDWTQDVLSCEKGISTRRPGFTLPPQPPELRCVHGILVGGGRHYGHGASARLDFRAQLDRMPLHRGPVGNTAHAAEPGIAEVASRLEELLGEHLQASRLARAKQGWKYKQGLVGAFDNDRLASYWASLPGTIQIRDRGRLGAVSLEELQAADVLTVVWHPSGMEGPGGPPVTKFHTPALTGADLRFVSGKHRVALFAERSVTSVRWTSKGYLVTDWTLGFPEETGLSPMELPGVEVAGLPDPAVIAVETHLTGLHRYDTHVLFNRDHPLIQWLVAVREACAGNRYGLHTRDARRLLHLLSEATKYTAIDMEPLEVHLKAWRDLPGLPSELRPPDIELTPEMFRLEPPGTS